MGAKSFIKNNRYGSGILEAVDKIKQKRELKPIGRHKNVKNAFFNQLVDTKIAKNAILCTKELIE